jgi:hypothetical protein
MARIFAMLVLIPQVQQRRSQLQEVVHLFLRQHSVRSLLFDDGTVFLLFEETAM